MEFDELQNSIDEVIFLRHAISLLKKNEHYDLYVPLDAAFEYFAVSIHKLPNVAELEKYANFIDIIKYHISPNLIVSKNNELGTIDNVPIMEVLQVGNVELFVIGGMLLPGEFKLRLLSEELVDKLRPRGEITDFDSSVYNTYFDLFFGFNINDGIFNSPLSLDFHNCQCKTNSIKKLGTQVTCDVCKEMHSNEHLLLLTPKVVNSLRTKKLNKRDDVRNIASEKQNRYFEPFHKALKQQITLEDFMLEVLPLIRAVFDPLSDEYLIGRLNDHLKYNLKIQISGKEKQQIVFAFRNLTKGYTSFLESI